MRFAALVWILIFNLPAAADSERDYFYLPADAQNVSEVSQDQYWRLLSQFQWMYAAEVLEKTGRLLVIENTWENPYFAGFAELSDGEASVTLWGGMARAPGATLGGLLAVLCHEVGHLIGGEPRQTIPHSSWATSEGQADFFAAVHCLPRFLRKYPDVVPNVEFEVIEICGGDLTCAKTVQAGLDLSRLTQKYSYRDFVPVNLKTPAPPSAELIRNSYPSDQCRLDTFVLGAQCPRCGPPACWAGSSFDLK